MKSKRFFFEKKNQKTFAPLRAGETPSGVTSKNQSFFASFCSQKEVLAFLLLFLPMLAHAQTQLAYVITGNPSTDQTSADGLAYISAYTSAHTSAELSPPAGITPGADDLSLYPLIYWPLTTPPTQSTCDALTSYMQHGGLLIIDTQGSTATSLSSGAGFNPQADSSLAATCLTLPPLEPLTPSNVLTHCFFILQDTPGRFTGAPTLIATAAARDADDVTPLIITQNDWAGAWARDATGAPEQSPIPGGEDQRTQADRTGVNLIIYALTGSYKQDQASVAATLNQLDK